MSALHSASMYVTKFHISEIHPVTREPLVDLTFPTWPTEALVTHNINLLKPSGNFTYDQV
jgi:hypothetical protein